MLTYMYSIYVHTTPDGRKYVGCTSQEPEKRFNHGRHYGHCRLFKEAIKEFGWCNITHEVIDTTDSKEEALKLEAHYILLYRSNEREFGYNLKVLDKHNSESKQKMSTSRIGVNTWSKGRKLSDETKHKMSEAMKLRWEKKHALK